MASFNKINDIVSACSNFEDLSTVSIVFNSHHVKTSKYGKYIRPVRITYNYKDNKREHVDNPDYYVNIPVSLEDVFEGQSEKYLAIVVDVNEKKEYTQPDGTVKVSYDKGIGLVRNPVAIKQLEDVEKQAYQIFEYVL